MSYVPKRDGHGGDDGEIRPVGGPRGGTSGVSRWADRPAAAKEALNRAKGPDDGSRVA
jgi:hypothetical protein